MNPHAFALEPESSVSANSTIWAGTIRRGVYSYRQDGLVSRRQDRRGLLSDRAQGLYYCLPATAIGASMLPSRPWPQIERHSIHP